MSLPAGTHLGPYEIATLIGKGGMGEVYRGRDTRLNRDVAVKILPATFANDPDRLRRFTLEAQAAGALNHPNVLAVFDIGSHGGAPFIVSELLDGESLRTCIDRGPLPLSKVLDYARQTANGLAAAHAKGITHRDIKPENLFLTGDGRVKILDFGLAKHSGGLEGGDVTAQQAVTGTGVILGTVGYMSPEQVRGQPTDHRTDIFSLGTVVYEMLAGQRAFDATSAVETMHAILTRDPQQFRADAAPVPPALDRIVRRCLEKNPAERFHSAHDLSLAIESIATGSRAATQDLSAAAPARAAAATTHAGLTRVVLWTLLLAAAAGAGALIHRAVAVVAPMEPPAIDYLTYSGHDSSPAASPDGKTVAFASNRDGVSRIWLKQVTGGAELALTTGLDDFPRFAPDGSSVIFVRTTGALRSLYRVPLLGGEPRKLLDDVTGADYSPEGSRLAFTRWATGDRKGSVVGLSDGDGGNAREIVFVPDIALVAPRWSPDGRTIAGVPVLAASTGRPRITLVDVSASRHRSLSDPATSQRPTAISSVVWTADSQAVLYSVASSLVATMTGSTARVMRLDVATGVSRPLLWAPNNSLVIDAIRPGRLLVDARSLRQNLRELTLDRAGASERWLTKGNSTDRQPIYSPDGTWVTFSSNRGGNLDLWTVNRTTGAVRRLTDDAADDWDVTYAPDGRHLLWCSNRTGPYEVWIANADGSGARQLTRDGVEIANPQQSPDGRWIVYIARRPDQAGLWRIQSDGTRPVRLVEGAVQVPEISPDGEYVIYLDAYNGRIRSLRLRDGSPVPFEVQVERRKATTAMLGRARWLPGGRAIAFLGQNEQGINGVFVQDFVPGRDTTATRRALGGFDPENSAETLAISPDGRYLTVAGWEQMFNIMVVNNVPGLDRSPK
jgi:Tol biopolymer transport system component